MSTWAISVADIFFNELLNLPQSISKKVSKVVKVLEKDPISAQGDAKKLKGYANNIYRVRIGDYRLFYSFGQGWVKLLSIRKRDERTYELELPEFEAPVSPPEPSLLHPNKLETKPSITNYVSAAGRSPLRSTNSDITTALPVEFTFSLLKQWQIPEEYWSDLLQVQNSEALLDLPLPDKYLSRILDNCYPRSLEEIERSRDYLSKLPKT